MGTVRSVASVRLTEARYSAVAYQPKPYYRPELDALRFFAFLSVFCAHTYTPNNRIWATIQNTGRFGVVLFFLLSAYLITELLRQEALRTGSVHLKKFYTRRVLRIWPLYLLIIATATIVGMIYEPWHVSALWLMSNVLFMGNWFVVAFGWPLNAMLSPLWTISVEEQFYLMVPGLQKMGGARAVNAVSCLFLIISYAYLLSQGLPQEHTLFQNSLVLFQFFAAGSLLANYLQGSTPQIKLPYRALMLLAGLGLWLMANRLGFAVHFKETATRMTPVYGSLALLAGTVLIFLSFLGVSEFRFPKPFLYLGTISYGLYIYHVAVLSLMHFLFRSAWGHRGVLPAAVVLSMIGSIAVASASYRWIESPFIRLKRRFELVRSKS